MNSSSVRQKLGFGLLPLVLLISYFAVIYRMMLASSVPPDTFHIFQLLATILLALSMIAVCFAYYFVIVRSGFSETVKSLFLSGALILLMLLMGECFFLHYQHSEGVGIQWSYKLWDKKYLSHRTYLHYTDSKGEHQSASFREPVSRSKSKKKAIWFIGDSFTFGFGLEQTDQTFPYQIELLLHGHVDCINLGDGGADTYKEKENFFAFEQQEKQLPDAVVWQYFGNDIDINDEGPDLYDQELAKHRSVQLGSVFLRDRSFLLDYLYWNYFVDPSGKWINTYSDFLNHAYQADSMKVDGAVLKDASGNTSPYRHHLIPLKETATYCKNQGVKFVVIIFPFLWKDGPENSELLYAKRIEADMKAEQTDVIDLTPLVKDIPVDKRIVNKHDPHPSILVDKIVADTVAKFLADKYNMRIKK
jgi:hypothetical protein